MKTKICFIIFVLCMTINVHSSHLNLKSKTSTIKIKSGAAFFIEKEVTGLKGRIIKDFDSELLGSIVTFSEGQLEDEGNTTKLTGMLDLVNNWIELLGGQKFSSKYGRISQKIKVSGKNNVIEGGVKLENDIELQDADSDVMLDVSNRLNGNVSLNGGKLFLKGDLKLVNGKRIIGPGYLNLHGNRLEFGVFGLTINEPLFFYDALDITLKGNMTVNNTLTFAGENYISGNGNILYLGEKGELLLQSNSTLWLTDIAIQGVAGNNIHGVADNSQIILQNVRWIQDEDFTFTKGHLDIYEKVYLQGYNKKFVYHTDMTSTIHKYATLVLDTGFTFSYDPLSTRKDMIFFEDNTSSLEMNGGTLYVTNTGMQLTTGALHVAIRSYVSVEDRGEIILGNNNANEDFSCRIWNSDTLELTSGTLSYKNVTPNIFCGCVGSTLKIGSNAALRLYQDFSLSRGMILFDRDSSLFIAEDKNIEATISALGRFNKRYF